MCKKYIVSIKPPALNYKNYNLTTSLLNLKSTNLHNSLELDVTYFWPVQGNVTIMSIEIDI